MSKQSKITSLLVIPLIASSLFLASPALASNPLSKEGKGGSVAITQGSSTASGGQMDVAGVVTGVSGTLLTISGTDSLTYKIDAEHATIMRDSSESGTSIVSISEINVGDTVLVRGKVANLDL